MFYDLLIQIDDIALFLYKRTDTIALRVIYKDFKDLGKDLNIKRQVLPSVLMMTWRIGEGSLINCKLAVGWNGLQESNIHHTSNLMRKRYS